MANQVEFGGAVEDEDGNRSEYDTKPFIDQAGLITTEGANEVFGGSESDLKD